MDAVIAVFAHHHAADVAVRRLVAAGCGKANLSVVGRGCHTAEDAVGITSAGGRIKFWGPRGEFWGGLWGLLFGGLFLTFPGMGIVIVLGYLAATTMLAVEDVTNPNGFNVLALLAGLGIPSGVAVRYESRLEVGRLPGRFPRLAGRSRKSGEGSFRRTTFDPRGPRRVAFAGSETGRGGGEARCSRTRVRQPGSR